MISAVAKNYIRYNTWFFCSRPSAFMDNLVFDASAVFQLLVSLNGKFYYHNSQIQLSTAHLEQILLASLWYFQWKIDHSWIEIGQINSRDFVLCITEIKWFYKIFANIRLDITWKFHIFCKALKLNIHFYNKNLNNSSIFSFIIKADFLYY